MDVVIVRHAIAHDRNPDLWPDDSLRPLTRVGRRRFRKAARGLACILPDVDLVLSSPFARAEETAEILESDAEWPAAELMEELGADRSHQDALRVLEEIDGVSSVALVGHEPTTSELVAVLTGGSPELAGIEMKKGAAALVSFEDRVAAGAGTLVWLLPPRVLRALG